jgi:hypothetical protein
LFVLVGAQASMHPGVGVGWAWVVIVPARIETTTVSSCGRNFFMGWEGGKFRERSDWTPTAARFLFDSDFFSKPRIKR